MKISLEAAENHQNIIQSSMGTIASMSLTKAGSKMGGALITPAVWAYSYATTNNAPSGVDASLYAAGFVGTIAAPATIIAGSIKAIVEDSLDEKLRHARVSENEKYRPFIKTCYRYASSSALINAQTIAGNGGTAWMHPNGIWLYISDKRGFLVSDYQPTLSITTYGPKLPLEKARNGRFVWGIRK